MIKKLRQNPYTRAGLVIVISGLILIIANNMIGKIHFTTSLAKINQVMAPIYIGIILAFIMCPIYNKIVKLSYRSIVKSQDLKSNHKKFIFSKVLASVLCMIIVLGIILLLSYIVLPQVISSVSELIKTMPERLDALSEWFKVNFSKMPQLAESIDKFAGTSITEIFKWVENKFAEGNGSSLVQTVSSGVFAVAMVAKNIVIGILLMLYLLNFKERLFAIGRKCTKAIFGKKGQERVFEFSGIINEVFIGFVVGTVLDSFIIAVLCYISMTFIGLPFAPMISLIVGCTNVIPFFGPFIGLIPSVLILMMDNPRYAMWFALMILILQQIDGNILAPRIVGSNIGISSFFVLLAVLVGGGLFGFIGMAFSVPIFAVIYRYFNKLIVNRLKSKDERIATMDYYNLDAYNITQEIEVSTNARNAKKSKTKKPAK